MWGHIAIATLVRSTGHLHYPWSVTERRITARDAAVKWLSCDSRSKTVTPPPLSRRFPAWCSAPEYVFPE